MPFLTAAQVQAAWANSNNVVLLASGGNNPEYGTSGSGIYVGKHGALKVLMSPNKEKRVLIATVPKNPDIQELKIESDDNVCLLFLKLYPFSMYLTFTIGIFSGRYAKIPYRTIQCQGNT